MADRIEAVVTMKVIYSFTAPAYGYGTETRYIYTMEAEDGTTYVWKTTAFMAEKVRDEENGWEIDAKGRKWRYDRVNRGDVIRIKATVKGYGEYKGQPQTEITRVKITERLIKAKTWEEIQAERAAEREAKAKDQRESVKGGDFIWTMPYRQYKEHYSDCETVTDSFKRNGNRQPCTIDVIIREGRLKASGVRGKHYAEYAMQSDEGESIVYYAISEETAKKRAEREFPGRVWECVNVYR